MKDKPADPRQMLLDFNAVIVAAEAENHICERHTAMTSHTVVSFTDASTLALRRRAVQRVLSAGIFAIGDTDSRKEG